jgi:hypothetical protein
MIRVGSTVPEIHAASRALFTGFVGWLSFCLRNRGQKTKNTP